VTQDFHRAVQGQCPSPSSTRTPQLYDRRSDEVSLDEVERILM
jgi:hypothetical protein